MPASNEGYSMRLGNMTSIIVVTITCFCGSPLFARATVKQLLQQVSQLKDTTFGSSSLVGMRGTNMNNFLALSPLARFTLTDGLAKRLVEGKRIEKIYGLVDLAGIAGASRSEISEKTFLDFAFRSTFGFVRFTGRKLKNQAEFVIESIKSPSGIVALGESGYVTYLGLASGNGPKVSGRDLRTEVFLLDQERAVEVLQNSVDAYIGTVDALQARSREARVAGEQRRLQVGGGRWANYVYDERHEYLMACAQQLRSLANNESTWLNSLQSALVIGRNRLALINSF